MTEPMILNEPMIMGDVNVVAPIMLGYPKHFFNERTGKGPKDEFAAEQFWPYRKDRPSNDFDMYTIPPDGRKMLLEMNSIRNDLRHHVSTELLYNMILSCKELNITIPSTNQFPLLHKDMMEIISYWTASATLYQRLLYIIFHKFHKEQGWLSSVVDSFLLLNNMFIIYQPPQPGKKKVTDNRGGFGTVARRAKAQTIRKYMSFLYKHQNWMIATSFASKKNRDYHIVTAGEFDNTITNEKKRNARLYYVVLPSTATDETTTKQNGLNKYFNMNCNMMMEQIIAKQKETGIESLPSYELKKIIIANCTINKRNLKKIVHGLIDEKVNNGIINKNNKTNDNEDVDIDDDDHEDLALDTKNNTTNETEMVENNNNKDGNVDINATNETDMVENNNNKDGNVDINEGVIAEDKPVKETPTKLKKK
jgi:hypothetical protein